MNEPKVLVVDDDAGMCEVLTEGLAPRGLTVTSRTSGEAAIEHLRAEDADVVVVDLNMRGMSGLDVCRWVADNRADVPVVVITAFGSLETAVGAIRAGAWDFITKPLEMDVLAIALDRAVRHRRLAGEVRRLRKALRDAAGFEDLVGESAPMRRLYDLVDRVAPARASVLITGETGTGKELVARAIHRRSPRSEGPYVALNCAAMPESLLESELFGHVRGAFTDAHARREGLFVRARGGTVLLDEVGEMPAAVQSKLLRALQERAVRPVGADEEVPIDVRVLAATHRDLEALVEEGRFRRDLYFRLNVVQIDVPPLRARGNDVLLLAASFLERQHAASGGGPTRLSRAAAERLLAYSWPGNVRELQNAIERATALSLTDEVTVDDLPDRVREQESRHALVPADAPGEILPLEEVERRYILRVLDIVQGHRSEAARLLGIDRKTLYRKLERWDDGAP